MLSAICFHFDQSKILSSGNGLTKLKAFSDKKNYVPQLLISVSDRIGNFVGKGENAFSPFPTIFLTAFFFCILKNSLTPSSICTHFNTLKKKFSENIEEKGEIAQNEQFHLFPQCFLCNLYLNIL